MIARLLAKRRVKSRARYAHLDDRDVVRAAEVVGEVMDGLMAKRVSGHPAETGLVPNRPVTAQALSWPIPTGSAPR